ncbi:MAG: hypothetical protein ACYC99_17490 [Candidatus Geothermincolia bacterium]
MRKSRLFIVLCIVAIAATVALIAGGCGGKSDQPEDPTGGRPEAVTAYEAVQYTKPAADKWQANNWMVQVRDGDPDGIGKDGKAKIWEVYYFSPTPEEDAQMFVIYNRGNIWPNAPGSPKGGDKGLVVYRKNKPVAFRVDSPEAVEVARRNGGGDFMDSHPDARASVVLRCKADYTAVGQAMPSPKYKWIWDVTFREPKAGAEALHIFIDGMNGDYITKELQKPPS